MLLAFTYLLETISKFSKDMELLKKEIEDIKMGNKEKYEVGDITTRIAELEKKLEARDNSYNDKRIAELEKGLYAQQQYSRRDCVELVGISENVKSEDLEKLVVSIFKKTGIEVTERHFHAVHRLHNKTTVIAKLINRKDVTNILKKKKDLCDLNASEKNSLSIVGKLYVNESLCGAYRSLLGKCNALYKRSAINAFYTINGKLMIKRGGHKNNEGNLVGFKLKKIEHVSDLEELYGKKMIDSLVRKIYY